MPSKAQKNTLHSTNPKKEVYRSIRRTPTAAAADAPGEAEDTKQGAAPSQEERRRKTGLTCIVNGIRVGRLQSVRDLRHGARAQVR